MWAFAITAVSEEKIKKNRPIRNKNCLWQPCLLMDRENMCTLEGTFYRCFLPSFSSFGREVSEEKIKMWKVNGRRTTDDGCQVIAKAHFAFGKDWNFTATIYRWSSKIVLCLMSLDCSFLINPCIFFNVYWLILWRVFFSYFIQSENIVHTVNHIECSIRTSF
jgi:hypothetical protein